MTLPSYENESTELAKQHRQRENIAMGKNVAILMMIQWLGVIVASIVLSPLTWFGEQSDVHPHVSIAVLLGGLISIVPSYVSLRYPNRTFTRYIVAFSQMLMSALIIHISGGRIEAHFHIFASLAFLSFYSDHRVLMFAMCVTAIDHILRGYLWPYSIYSVSTGAEWRWVEHVLWVACEVGFLCLSIRHSQRELMNSCRQQIELQKVNEQIENRILEQTGQLRKSEALARDVIASSLDAIIQVDSSGIILECNPSAEKTLGIRRLKYLGKLFHEQFLEEKTADIFKHELSTYQYAEKSILVENCQEIMMFRPFQDPFPAEFFIAYGESLAEQVFTIYFRDITKQKEAEKAQEEAQKAMVSSARRAGIAEISTGILHNVGNVLNSVNVSANSLHEMILHSKIDRISNVGELIQEHADDLGHFFTEDEKGKRLPGYLARLAKQLETEQEQINAEMTELLSAVEHVKKVISMQQSMAKTSGMVEPCNLIEIADDALAMLTASFAHHSITVKRNYSKLPRLMLDRQKIMQILVNLIKNGKEAVSDSNSNNDRILSITIAPRENNRVIVSVKDSGMGISKENLKKMFSHGFTTKPEGHGFGLHSCANFATEMGGRMTVESDGLGQGATFTLELPMEQIADDNEKKSQFILQ